MVKSQIHAEIHADLAAVWALVTDVSRAGWRSDVENRSGAGGQPIYRIC